MTAPRKAVLLEGHITEAIIGAFYTVHRELGFGFREHIYALAMEHELRLRGHRVDREVSLMVYYRGEPLAGQSADMIVDGRVIVENKSKERLDPEATEQLFGYLCSTPLEVGMVLHFGREARFYRVICENRLKRSLRHTEAAREQ